jgi:hypothetical protein
VRHQLVGQHRQGGFDRRLRHDAELVEVGGGGGAEGLQVTA